MLVIIASILSITMNIDFAFNSAEAVSRQFKVLQSTIQEWTDDGSPGILICRSRKMADFRSLCV